MIKLDAVFVTAFLPTYPITTTFFCDIFKFGVVRQASDRSRICLSCRDARGRSLSLRLKLVKYLWIRGYIHLPVEPTGYMFADPMWLRNRVLEFVVPEPLGSEPRKLRSDLDCYLVAPIISRLSSQQWSTPPRHLYSRG